MEYKITFEDGTEGYLEHFGVKGMHWGVWNAETRARYLGLHGARGGSGAGSSSGYGGLTDKQKKAVKIALASAAVVAVLGVGLYAAKKTGVLDDGILAVKNVFQKNKKPPATVADDLKPDILTHPFEESLPKIHGKETMSESVKKANPLFGSWGHGDNCTRCTTALEMRARGFDVEATPMEQGQSMMSIASAFEDTKVHGGMYDVLTPQEYSKLKTILGDTSLSAEERTKKYTRYLLMHPDTTSRIAKANTTSHADEFISYVNKLPDGARGNLGINYPSGGGHSIFWTKANGKLELYDGQTGDKYKDAKKLLDGVVGHEWIRTDNKAVNWDVMQTQVRAHNPYYDTLPVTKRMNADDGILDENFAFKLVTSPSADKFVKRLY